MSSRGLRSGPVRIEFAFAGYHLRTMQNDLPTYETDADRLRHPKPDEAEGKLGSARPDSDPLDAVAGVAPAGRPTEYVAAEYLPTYVVPTEALPVATQPTDFMTKEARPTDYRPTGEIRPI